MSSSVFHWGKTVTIVDLSNKKTPQIIETLKEAEKKISTMPPKSARLLTDVTNVEVNMDVVKLVLQFAKRHSFR